MSRLNKEYPVWNKLKMYMEHDPDITKDQIKSYKRKVERNAFIRCHLHLLQIQENTIKRNEKELEELRSELKRIECCKLVQVIRENDKLKEEIKVMKEDIQMLKNKLKINT
jgi:mevalonate kinase